ncbi:MAG: hypothetical protein ACPGQL_09385 [Thermoplasmatota archaeon]
MMELKIDGWRKGISSTFEKVDHSGGIRSLGSRSPQSRNKEVL